MNIIDIFKDDQYPRKGKAHSREISRAIVMRPDGLFAIHLIRRNDAFGDWSYFETPGGGVDDGESPEQAVVRECEEELGYQVEIIQELGTIKDEYALIGRTNINHYYLCKTREFVGKHLVSDGDTLIAETLYLPIKEIIQKYEALPNEKIPLLLKRRELPIWKLTKKIINN